MKLEVGMYLRHSGLEGEYPIIQKITELKKPGRCGGKYKVFTDKCGDWFIDSDYIELDKSKYSFDLLELIEAGDVISFKFSDDVYKVLCVPNKEVGCEDFYFEYDISQEFEDLRMTPEMVKGQIKSIITHEQIETMEYKVGE